MKKKKEHLPTKVCLTCGKPFTWRKKWTLNWDNVKFVVDDVEGIKIM